MELAARIWSALRGQRRTLVAAALAGVLCCGIGSNLSAQQVSDVDELNGRIVELFRAGRYAEAVPIAQQVLAIRESTLGRNHPDVAVALNNLAALYDSQGLYADAEPLYQRALAILEQTLGHDHLDVSAALNNLALLYQMQGRYPEAERLYLRSLSLSIRQKALDRDHPDIAQSLNNLAGLYEAQGRYAEAEPLYRRSLAILEQALGRDDPDVAFPLNNLANLYQTRGCYAEAETLYQRALTIREHRLGLDHPDVASALNNLATLYRSEGRYADAEPLYRRSLAILEQAFGPGHPQVAGSLNNLAVLYDSQGRYADAEPLYHRVLAIWERVLGRDHPTVAATLNNLAVLYLHQSRYAEAESFGRLSLAIRETELGRDHPDVAVTLNNLAAIYEIQGRYIDAEASYQRSLDLRERTLGRDHPDVAQVLNNLAGLYENQRRHADALPIVRRTISQGTADKVVALPVLFNSRAQNLLSAPQGLTDSYDIVQRATSSAAAGAITKLAARFAAGTDELAQLVRRDQDLTVEAEALDKAVVAFVSKPPAQRSAASEEAIHKRIEAVKVERAALRQTFDRRFPDYVALSRPQPVSLQDTQRLLADDEALLVFDFGTKSYGWIITRTGADWKELEISGPELDTRVTALRARLTNERQRFSPELSYRIYQTTFGVFADQIAAKKRLSVVTNGALTSLPLQLLVTVDPRGKTLKQVDWLVRSHAVTILPSVASLKALRGGSQASSARKPMIAFADPVFSKAPPERAQGNTDKRSITSFYRGTQIDLAGLGKSLIQLPGTRREVQRIATELKSDSRDVRLGVAATETAVKQAPLDQYRIVYFATHGLVAGDLELFAKSKAEPALALTIPQKPTDVDDGLLTASEVAQLKLNADWVVLSACNTAAAEKPGAEALSGLARASSTPAPDR
jgi:tetratricopeptide (TPR) repeat protein/CHAT domain-containing protein